ncbi:hypothetical protein C9374_001152 [Naegleria lovaniensis]|uniref:Uncharacterized protein n=1 Tax=Naegleria lovaniensis TaxID=51637 RepID=A0AA88GWD0_NAELO|nr:uncharacterized protein C9374_001152 [Naegleria lovaniensis]KAG2387558.1 hypothetical protein C9374_001152 [Naegleria lovaniensis]
MHNHNTFNENYPQQVENDWDSPELALIFPELNTHVVFSQQDIDKIERETYEVAFEIFSEHLDEKTAGDCHIGGLSKKMIQEVRQVLDAINHCQDLELKQVENEGTSIDQLRSIPPRQG